MELELADVYIEEAVQRVGGETVPVHETIVIFKLHSSSQGYLRG